jgi:hypothetical protein
MHVIAHEDVLILRKPESSWSSGEPKCSRTEPECPDVAAASTPDRFNPGGEGTREVR